MNADRKLKTGDNQIMETVAEYSEDVPNWALSYIVNGDASGLESDEIDMVDDWMEFFSDKAKELGGNVVYSTTDDTDDFCSTPAFGLACDTTKTDVLILAPAPVHPVQLLN